MLSERRHRVYTTARLFFSPPTLLNSKTEAKRPYMKDIEPTTPGGFGAWGMAISEYHWAYGTFISDNYYIGVDSNTAVYVGLQVNGHTDITWKKITS